jgi:hypothetical protein
VHESVEGKMDLNSVYCNYGKVFFYKRVDGPGRNLGHSFRNRVFPVRT